MSVPRGSESAIWQMLDSLRGQLSTSEISVALASLIFWRWAEFEEAEQDAIAAFEDLAYRPSFRPGISWRDLPIQDLREFERLIFQIPAVVGDFANSRNPMIANAAMFAATEIEKLCKPTVEVLAKMIDWLIRQPFETPADRLAIRDMLDEVLRNNNDRFSGSFYTPPKIAELMVGMAKPLKGESVYDPCFGSAGLLTASLESANHHRNGKFDGAIEQCLQLAGMELDSVSFMIGITRLGLSGISHTNLNRGDSLREPELCYSKGGFDVVLANPPWGFKIDLYDLEGRYLFPTKDSTSLFLQPETYLFDAEMLRCL